MREASYVLVFTGAGISTRSGIPDYRGPKGVWKTREPVYWQDFMADEAARIEYWDQKLEGWEGFRDAQPNAGHLALAELERRGRLQLLVTQNIDGLHMAAGNSEERVVEIHGSNRRVACQTCGERTDPEAHFRHFAATRTPPLCHCGGYQKPATISFGQSLVAADLERSSEGARRADLCLAIGTSLVVEPAASICLLAARTGATYAIVNRGQTGHDDACDLRYDADAAELLPALVEAL